VRRRHCANPLPPNDDVFGFKEKQKTIQIRKLSIYEFRQLHGKRKTAHRGLSHFRGQGGLRGALLPRCALVSYTVLDGQTSDMAARLRILIVATLLACGGGCSGGGKHPATAPVSGTVTYQGKAVEGATVSFSLVGGGGVSTAITDAAGKYVLRTFGEADGAVPGDYKVTITKIKAQGRSPGKTPDQISEEYAALQARGEPIPEPVIQYLVPEKYSTAQSTPEQRTVKAGEPNVIDFQLAD